MWKSTSFPYFEPLGVTLAGLQPRQIQSFYLHEAETLKNTSILRFHANLHKALKYAVRIDLIPSNPVDKVDRPKPQAFMASYYSAEEMEKALLKQPKAISWNLSSSLQPLRTAPCRGDGLAVGRPSTLKPRR